MFSVLSTEHPYTVHMYTGSQVYIHFSFWELMSYILVSFEQDK
jgi:hypothetical protein